MFWLGGKSEYVIKKPREKVLFRRAYLTAWRIVTKTIIALRGRHRFSVGTKTGYRSASRRASIAALFSGIGLAVAAAGRKSRAWRRRGRRRRFCSRSTTLSASWRRTCGSGTTAGSCVFKHAPLRPLRSIRTIEGGAIAAALQPAYVAAAAPASAGARTSSIVTASYLHVFKTA